MPLNGPKLTIFKLYINRFWVIVGSSVNINDKLIKKSKLFKILPILTPFQWKMYVARLNCAISRNSCYQFYTTNTHFSWPVVVRLGLNLFYEYLQLVRDFLKIFIFSVMAAIFSLKMVNLGPFWGYFSDFTFSSCDRYFSIP